MKKATLSLFIIGTMIVASCSHRSADEALDALAEGDLDLAREIYAGGVDPDKPVKGQTPLTMAACQAPGEAIELLLEAGADPDLPNGRRLTPLIVSARCGNLPAVRALLDGGAEVNLSSPGGTTALTAAQEAGKEEVVLVVLAAGAKTDGATSRYRRRANGY